MLSLPCCTDFSLAEVARLLSSCGAWLPVVVASLVAEHRLQGARASAVAAWGLQSAGSVVMAHGLSCSVWDGIFLGAHVSGHWQVEFLPLSLQGSPKWLLGLLFYLTLFHKHFPCHYIFFYKFPFNGCTIFHCIDIYNLFNWNPFWIV